MQKTAVDHLGNRYSSESGMCAEYGISRQLYTFRRKKGWTVEKALTTPCGGKHHSAEKVADHLGNLYNNKREMCEAYGILDTTYYSRLARGCSKEEALTGKKWERKETEKVTDHKGNRYSSVQKMCEVYGIKPDTYRYRVKQGWGKKEALTRTTRKYVTHKKENVSDTYKNT